MSLHRQGRAHSANIDRPYHLVPFLAVLGESSDAARQVNAEPAASSPVGAFVTARQVAIHSTLIHRLGVLDRMVDSGGFIGKMSVFRAGLRGEWLICYRLARGGFRPKRKLLSRPGGAVAEPVVVVRPFADTVQYGERLARSSQRRFNLCELVRWYEAGEVIRCAA